MLLATRLRGDLAARSDSVDGPDGAEPLQCLRRQAEAVFACSRAIPRSHDTRPVAAARTVAGAQAGAGAFFGEIIEHSISDRERKGCFLVNSALEVAPHDAACRAVIAEQFGEIEAFFKKCIVGAQADGTVSSDIDAADMARLLLGVLLGVRVLARTKPRREVLEGVVRPALTLLKPRRKRKAKQ